MANIDDVMHKLCTVEKELQKNTTATTEIRTKFEGWEKLCKQKHKAVDENQARTDKKLNALPERVGRLEDTVATWKWYIRATLGTVIGAIVAAAYATWKTLTEGR